MKASFKKPLQQQQCLNNYSLFFLIVNPITDLIEHIQIPCSRACHAERRAIREEVHRCENIRQHRRVRVINQARILNRRVREHIHIRPAIVN